MTNIKENTKTKNVQSHIDKAYQYLDDNLRSSYSAATQDILKKNGVLVSRSTINNVRSRKAERLDVLNALLQVAKKNKAQVEELIHTVNEK